MKLILVSIDLFKTKIVLSTFCLVTINTLFLYSQKSDSIIHRHNVFLSFNGGVNYSTFRGYVPDAKGPASMVKTPPFKGYKFRTPFIWNIEGNYRYKLHKYISLQGGISIFGHTISVYSDTATLNRIFNQVLENPLLSSRTHRINFELNSAAIFEFKRLKLGGGINFSLFSIAAIYNKKYLVKENNVEQLSILEFGRTDNFSPFAFTSYDLTKDDKYIVSCSLYKSFENNYNFLFGLMFKISK